MENGEVGWRDEVGRGGWGFNGFRKEGVKFKWEESQMDGLVPPGRRSQTTNEAGEGKWVSRNLRITRGIEVLAGWR